MATCLKCDNCNAVVTENDEDLPRWWTVKRYGSDWIDEPGAPKRYANQPIMMHTTVIDGLIEMDFDDASNDEIEEAMMDEFMEESQGIAVGLTLHFCKAACLAEWGGQASAFED